MKIFLGKIKFNSDSTKIELKKNDNLIYTLYLNKERIDSEYKYKLTTEKGKVIEIRPFSELEMIILKFKRGEFNRDVKLTTN